jgi:hypothetical protein
MMINITLRVRIFEITMAIEPIANPYSSHMKRDNATIPKVGIEIPSCLL